MNKQETCAYLRAHGVPFEVTEHAAVYNMAEAEALCLPHPEADAKNLFVRDDKKHAYCLITVQGDKRVDLKAFRRAHGTRPLSLASPEELWEYLGLTPGSVTPLGALNDPQARVKVYIDRALLSGEGLIGAHPNDNTATVWLKTTDLIHLLREHGSEVETVEL